MESRESWGKKEGKKMNKVQNNKSYHLIILMVILSFTLFSCNNPKKELLLGHIWAVDSILHKDSIIFSHQSKNTIVVSNAIVFKDDNFIRMPWIVNATPNNGYWEIKKLPNHPAPLIKITQLPYDNFNGVYSIDIIKKSNGMIFLILKSDNYTFKCSTAI